jgi:hypothetical protein
MVELIVRAAFLYQADRGTVRSTKVDGRFHKILEKMIGIVHERPCDPLHCRKLRERIVRVELPTQKHVIAGNIHDLEAVSLQFCRLVEHILLSMNAA